MNFKNNQIFWINEKVLICSILRDSLPLWWTTAASLQSCYIFKKKKKSSGVLGAAAMSSLIFLVQQRPDATAEPLFLAKTNLFVTLKKGGTGSNLGTGHDSALELPLLRRGNSLHFVLLWFYSVKPKHSTGWTRKNKPSLDWSGSHIAC